jgi:hypothetical protein
MTIVNDLPAQGTLTGGGTIDTVITATGDEFHTVFFTNYSGSDRTIEFFLNGTADVNRVGKGGTLQANGGYCRCKVALGNGDTFRARASAASSIVWTDALQVQS